MYVLDWVLSLLIILHFSCSPKEDNHGNSYIYEILSWNTNPGKATGICLGIIFVAIPLIHISLYCLAKFRDYLWANLFNNSKQIGNTDVEMNSLVPKNFQL